MMNGKVNSSSEALRERNEIKKKRGRKYKWTANHAFESHKVYLKNHLITQFSAVNCINVMWFSPYF